MKKTLLINTFLLTFLLIFNGCSEKNPCQEQLLRSSKRIYKVEPGVFSVDIEKSNIEWEGTKTTGSHNGNIMLRKGTIDINKKGEIKKGTFEFDMTSIICTDLADKPKRKKSLESHLKDPDFFNTASHPTAIFTITNTKNNTMSGVLTIKGIPQEINFCYTQTAPRTYKAEIIVDRTLFDIKYKSKSVFPDIGDHFIDDNFTIILNPIVFM